jgi:hypothetical protein
MPKYMHQLMAHLIKQNILKLCFSVTVENQDTIISCQ